MKNNCEINRDASIDVIKGICILLVVACHTITFDVLPLPILRVFESVFVNSFFMVSGWLVFKPSDEKIVSENHGKRGKHSGYLIKRKLKILLVPYVAFSLLTIIYHVFICVLLGNTYVSDMYSGWTVVLRDFFCFFSLLGIGTLWFLPILFFSYSLLIFFIDLLHCWKSHIRILVFVIITMSCLLASFYFRGYVFDEAVESIYIKILNEFMNMLYRVLYGTAYTFIGFGIHSFYIAHKEVCDKKNVRILGIAILIVLSILAYNISVMYELFGVFCCLSFFIITMVCVKKVRWFKRGVTFFEFFGKNSLIIMIYHYLFLYPIEKPYFSGGAFFVVNLLTTTVIVLLVKDKRWHKVLMGKE